MPAHLPFLGLEMFFMATATDVPPLAERTLADLLEELGEVPPSRILLTPAPGTATEQDVLEAERRTGCAPELIDGVLVEKTVGYPESCAGGGSYYFSRRIRAAKQARNCYRRGGHVANSSRPGSNPRRLLYFPRPPAWREGAGSGYPQPCRRIWPLRFFRRETRRAKWRGSFATILPPECDWCGSSITAAGRQECTQRLTRFETLAETGVLDGGDVLPGFRLPLGVLFAELDS